MDLGAAEQQGGGPEQGLQGSPGRGRGEQHCAGADQGHRGGGEEDERERLLLRLRSAQ